MPKTVSLFKICSPGLKPQTTDFERKIKFTLNPSRFCDLNLTPGWRDPLIIFFKIFLPVL